MVQFSAEDVPDLTGRIILVTGGNNGLGQEAIRAFVRKGAKVYMAARTESKARKAIETIKSDVPAAEIHYIPLDLTSFASVKAAADAFASREQSLHVLLNNAGIMMVPYDTTKEGYEVQFGTNHMGHFLLTKLLLPTLERTAKAASAGSVRIVNVSSLAHGGAFYGIPFDDLQMDKSYTVTRYGVSKLANILHARELAKRYRDSNIISVSLHPGVIASDLYLPFVSSNFIVNMAFNAFKRFSTSIKEGSLNQIYLSTTPDLTQAGSGEFYMPVGVKNGGMFLGASSYTKDEKMAEKLWNYSEEEVKKHGY